jgi:hypothetical protein
MEARRWNSRLAESGLDPIEGPRAPTRRIGLRFPTQAGTQGSGSPNRSLDPTQTGRSKSGPAYRRFTLQNPGAEHPLLAPATKQALEHANHGATSSYPLDSLRLRLRFPSHLSEESVSGCPGDWNRQIPWGDLMENP